MSLEPVLMEEEHEKDWIERVADASERKHSGSSFDRALADFVLQHEVNKTYANVVEQAIETGGRVSLWELVDALLTASRPQHPCEDTVLQLMQAYDRNGLTRQDFKDGISREWRFVHAERVAADRIVEHLRRVENGIDANAASRQIEIDRKPGIETWRRLRPGSER